MSEMPDSPLRALTVTCTPCSTMKHIPEDDGLTEYWDLNHKKHDYAKRELSMLDDPSIKEAIRLGIKIAQYDHILSIARREQLAYINELRQDGADTQTLEMEKDFDEHLGRLHDAYAELFNEYLLDEEDEDDSPFHFPDHPDYQTRC